MSGSTPPLEIINPFSFLFLWAFYGGGVLLVRELWVRWGRGYLRLMLLGLSYGIIEEGLAVKSFFDPQWADLGVLATYGRVFGVNLVWAVWLSIFHAIFSISVPILLIDIFYSELKEMPLLGKKGLKITLVAFISALLITFFLLNRYPPPPVQYSIAFLITVLLVLKTKTLRTAPPKLMSAFTLKHPMSYGTLFTLSLFILYMFIPNTSVPFVIPVTLGPLFTVHLYSQMEKLPALGRFALVIGILSPFLLFYDMILELNNIFGMSAVGVGTFIVLLWKYRRMKSLS
ncbi:hypothetical protein PAP_08680 [Palaeococcus pacificus DY20341]|uniref:Uncharacterized protein n=2 Tax=Palaeococcus TaxID=83867 RepID=A0A075LVV0_9EURY|nr:hypothetical protein PAP_08680 [Palaeococcus pacificus DY20341]